MTAMTKLTIVMPHRTYACKVKYNHWVPRILDWIAVKTGQPKHVDATTFNRCIRVRADMIPQDLLAHEFVHIIQEASSWRVLFWISYIFHWLERGYLKNPYELAAWNAQADWNWTSKFTHLTADDESVTITIGERNV